ncbi:protein phosphatase 2C domain-containing protein [Catenulispora rubra]|uniref:protein phosphatase 2C domain-containing protein n=1 Tax=Catenulispora rubra TaxID=280293 RepID=UPI001892059A|nr:protein phosphatase 2C domain-containing protein [Catenulispora rubra]
MRPWGPVAGWTQTGTSHVARGRQAQDAFLIRQAQDGNDDAPLVIAVADGVGSRHRSALGAHLAVDVACRILARDVPDPGASAAIWTDWIRAAATAITDELRRCVMALTPDSDPAELSRTMAAAVLHGPWAGFAAIGDCFGAVQTSPASSTPPTWHLVLPPTALTRAFALWDPDLTAVLLATDGCMPLALERPETLGLPATVGPQPAPAFFDEVARGIRADNGSAALADLLRTGAPGRSADDITVVCALAGGH